MGWMKPGQRMSKPEIARKLEKYGIARAVVHFSGGNDEGGPDGYDFYDAEGKVVEGGPFHAEAHQGWGDSKGKWMVYTGAVEDGTWPNGSARKIHIEREATEEEVEAAEVVRQLVEPIYDRWGSFAGDFSVDGTVEFDGDFHMKYSESSYEDYEDDF